MQAKFSYSDTILVPAIFQIHYESVFNCQKCVFNIIQLTKTTDTPKFLFLFFDSSLAACGGTVDQVFFKLNLKH